MTHSLKRYSVNAWMTRFGKAHEKVKKLAYPLLNKTDRTKSEVIWSAFLSELNETDFRPSLIHGDTTGEKLSSIPIEEN